VNSLRVACLCGAQVSPGTAFLYTTGCLALRWLNKLPVPPPYAGLTPSHNLQITALNFFSLIATSVSSKNSHTGLVRFLVDILPISLTKCPCAVSHGRIRKNGLRTPPASKPIFAELNYMYLHNHSSRNWEGACSP